MIDLKKKDDPNIQTVEYNVKINTINDVKTFVTIMNTTTADAILKSDPYAVDAKSIMGIFSLDLGKTVKLHLRGKTDEISYLEKTLETEGFLND